MIELTLPSPVLTNEEAVRFLRLDSDYNELDDAVKALHRLVRDGRLRLLRCGKSYKFAVAELERYVADETSAFEPSKRRASDHQTDGDEVSRSRQRRFRTNCTPYCLSIRFRPDVKATASALPPMQQPLRPRRLRW